MNRAQRSLLADKLLNLANIGAAALVFGQAFNQRPLSLGLTVVGILLWCVLAGYALLLTRRRS